MATVYRAKTVHRLYAALDEAIERYGVTVRTAYVKELQAAWRDALPAMRRGAAHAKAETGIMHRRRVKSMGKPPTRAPLAIPAGKLVAVASREGGDEAINLLIGKWVLLSADDALLRRAAGSIGVLMDNCIGGAYGQRQQVVALAHAGGVALIRQLPSPKVELWDVGEERD